MKYSVHLRVHTTALGITFRTALWLQVLGIQITGASPNRPQKCYNISFANLDLNTIASKRGHAKPSYCFLFNEAKVESFAESQIVTNELTFRVVSCTLRNKPSKLQLLNVNRMIVRSIDIYTYTVVFSPWPEGVIQMIPWIYTQHGYSLSASVNMQISII